MWHLLVQHVRWELSIILVVEAKAWKWLRGQIFVWVESSEGHDISKVVNGNHWHGVLNWRVELWTMSLISIFTLVIIDVAICLLLLIVLEFFRHWRQSDTLWQIWKWVNELSLFFVIVVERAAFTKLAFTRIEEVSAWHSLVVGVDSTKGSFTKVGWKWLKGAKIKILIKKLTSFDCLSSEGPCANWQYCLSGQSPLLR